MMESQTREKARIVIIGAGLAGLSAAHKLIQIGYKDLLIIEAASQPGGRIESYILDDGSRLDMGAQWLHGERENPVYNWLESMNLIECCEEEEVEFEGLFRTQLGEEPPKEIVTRVLEILMDTRHSLYKNSHLLDPKCLPADIYRKQLEFNARKCTILKRANPRLVESILKWFELYETIDNSCEDISLLSIKAYSNWSDYDDGKMVRLRGGWQRLVTTLFDSIGEEKFIFSSKVIEMRYSSDGVVLKHSKGVISCDHVIVTFSLGVMKNLPLSFFNPMLEKEKRDLISNLGFGVVNKIFLQFDRPFLSVEKGLKLLWIKGEPVNFPSALPDWTKFLTGFDLVSTAPNYLMCWVGGKGAEMMEDIGEHEVGETCMKILRIFLPDRELPKLVSVKRSSWGNNPFVRGSYSYESVNSSVSLLDSKQLWEPLVVIKQDFDEPIPRILFAGEATAASMYATAHGALTSGWREAQRLGNFLDHLKRKM